MPTEDILTIREGPVLTVTFNRPHKRNAMTWAMYEGLFDACEQADGDPATRVLVLRGAGGRAFVAGTDIAQFNAFSSGADGVAYEERITRVVQRLENVQVPSVAAIQGNCIGGGLLLAAACDLRIATSRSTFGVPIARTLGNCLSMNSVRLLVEHLGTARTLDLILRARLLSGEDVHAAGFVTELCEDDELDARLDALTRQLSSHAPLTMWAAKEAVQRLRHKDTPNGNDFIARVFGSDDFKRAVEAFGDLERIRWHGR